MARLQRFPIMYSSMLVLSGMRGTRLDIVYIRVSTMPLGRGRPHRIRILHQLKGLRRMGIDDSSVWIALGAWWDEIPEF